jgi:hypothetical protein
MFLTSRQVAICAMLVMLAAVWTIAAGGAFAQSNSFSFRARSYINPFPQTDRYHLHVFGDYLAAGLASGMEEAFEKDGSLKIVNSTKSSAGLARPDRTDWATDIAELAKTQPIHIAVLMMGMNDVRSIRLPGGSVSWGTEEWRVAYSKQADTLIKALKDQNIAVYWIGMPIMASSKTSEAMALLNDIFRERSYINGTKYIDTWSGFTDQLGGFSAFGPDLTGQNKRLRESDGVSFTARGNRKLANYVEVIIRRDLASARSERNISLAGDSEEQQRLVPKAEKNTRAVRSGEPETTSPETDAADTVPGSGSPLPGLQDNAGNLAADPSGPTDRDSAGQGGAPNAAISAFASGYSPPGETIIGDVSEGVTGLATVSPIGNLSVNTGERRLPVTERLYYKSLVEGEAQTPKPGRADDFRWPRS